jgi:hypothetical protein
MVDTSSIVLTMIMFSAYTTFAIIESTDLDSNLSHELIFFPNPDFQGAENSIWNAV